PPLVVYMASSMPQSPATNVYRDQVQALAASGFAVLLVNGRGTFGFGQAHMEAVANDLDRALREDCEDMIAALAREGVIDPKRVAAIGERMGGAMAVYLATTSKAFAAAININAPPEVSRRNLLSYGVGRDLSALQRDLGGWRRAAEIAESLSVEKNLKTCLVPTLHLYNDAPANKGALDDFGRRVRRAAEGAGSKAQVGVAYLWHDVEKPATSTQRAREEAALVVRMVTFLEAAMPPL
ncbi:MAG TPA: prolyl oligopeptidase family serine peptidase, partial [Opitutaceae bacterium]